MRRRTENVRAQGLGGNYPQQAFFASAGTLALLAISCTKPKKCVLKKSVL